MKDFLLIGNKNCIAHKDFFKLMMDRRVNIGYTRPGDFDQPDGTPLKTLQGLTRWFTTLSVDDKPALTLTATYDPEKYPKYDNYDAINVDRVQDIPYDYEGVMGVPITFLDHYSPEQFEILGATQRGCHDELPDTKKYDSYREITQEGAFTGSSGGKTNENANVVGKPNKGNYFIDDNGRTIYSLYQRIFIRRKK